MEQRGLGDGDVRCVHAVVFEEEAASDVHFLVVSVSCI